MVVPGTSDPWLAGLSKGATASGGDVAPLESPVLVPMKVEGDQLLAIKAYGLAGNTRNPRKADGPDGGSWYTSHKGGARNGIANYKVPINALVGVFLSDQAPNTTAAPSAMNFSPDGNVKNGVSYHTLFPQLKQVFFIGNGLDNGGGQQYIDVPYGATRLYLGVADSSKWADNEGAFEALVLKAGHAPEPGSLILMTVGGLGLTGFRLLRRRKTVAV